MAREPYDLIFKEWMRPFIEADERDRINKLHDEAIEFEKNAKQMNLFGKTKRKTI